MKTPFAQRIAEKFDDAVRHRSVFGRNEWLRNLLRKPYHRLINLHGRGITVNLGGCVSARLPPEYASKLMEEYERAEFEQIHAWCAANPAGLFVDVGCSQGYMSCAALFCSSRVEILAIDSDTASLKCARRVCHYAPENSRLHLLRCLVAGKSVRVADWRSLASETEKLLASAPGHGEPGSHHYIKLNDEQAAQAIPRFTLDDLLAREIEASRNMLVKCDVEGAEHEVLLGAARLMAVAKPPLLLSVHPHHLPGFGRTPEQISTLLAARSYTSLLLATDHEQHWHCLPAATRA